MHRKLRRTLFFCQIVFATGCATSGAASLALEPGTTASATQLHSTHESSKLVLTLGIVILVVGIFLLIPVLASDT